MTAQRLLQQKGLFLGLLAAICYGFIPLFTKSLQHPTTGLPLSSATILFYRFGIAALVLAALMLWKKVGFRITFPEFLRLTLLAFLSDGAALFLIAGYGYMPSGVATTLHFTYPVFTACFMMLFFGEPRRPSTILSIVIALLGISLLSWSGQGRVGWMGIILELISAICFALYLIRVNRSCIAKMPVMKLTFYVMFLGTVIFLAAMFNERTEDVVAARYAILPTLAGLGNLLALSLICTVVTNLALVRATQQIGPTVAAVLGALEPVTAIVLGILFMNEQLTARIIFGILLIIPAVLLIATRKR